LAKIIALCNQKGGVGKTTTSVNLAASLAASERRVLLIDFDPQANSTSGFGFDKTSVITSSYDFIVGEKAHDEVILPSGLSFLDLMPSHSNLVGVELELVNQERREFRLKELLGPLDEKYDYILIDSPPSLGLLTLNAMVASKFLLVPVQCEYYALEGLSELVKTIDLVRDSLNPELSILGLVLTMFDSRNNLAKQVEGDIRSYFNKKVFDTVIPRNVRLSEAPSYGKPIILYDVKSRGAQSYLELSREFIERMEPFDGFDRLTASKGKALDKAHEKLDDTANLEKESDYGTT
jgi:chromosome partitioning protein